MANIVRVIKSRRLRWVGQIARMEEGGSAFKILTGKSTGKTPVVKFYECSVKSVSLVFIL